MLGKASIIRKDPTFVCQLPRNFTTEFNMTEMKITTNDKRDSVEELYNISYSMLFAYRYKKKNVVNIFNKIL